MSGGVGMWDYGLGWAQEQYDRQEPPYREPEKSKECSVCHADILAGENYYQIGEFCICTDCMIESKREAS